MRNRWREGRVLIGAELKLDTLRVMFGRGFTISFSSSWLAVLAVSLTLGQGTTFSAPKKKKKAKPVAEEQAPPVEIAKARPLRTEGPNVVFILADGLNDWVGFMGGHPQARTPNLDRLAKMGLRFTNAHAAYTEGDASRAALLSGMWPWKSGISKDEINWKQTAQVLDKDTIAEQLQLAGFMTAAAGQISRGTVVSLLAKPTREPKAAVYVEPSTGWDVVSTPVKVTTPSAKNLEGLPAEGLAWGKTDVKEEDTLDGKNVSWAVDYLLNQPADTPFILTIGLSCTAPPWQIPATYLDERPLAQVKLPESQDADLADLPGAGKAHLNDGSLHQRLVKKNLPPAAVRGYLASITYCDALVGRVLDALEKSPHKDNTVIIFASTQGRGMGEKQLWSEGGLWEHSTRVPLVIVAPKVTTPDTQTAQPVSLVDLYPTVCDLTALPKPTYLDGTSLLPLMKDPALKLERPAYTAAGTSDKPSYAVRTERYRYIRYSDGAQELYDHQTDPREATNRLAANAVPPAELAATIAAWKDALPKEWASTRRSLATVKLDAAADGSVTYWLQPGDNFPASGAPDVFGHGLDIEAVFAYNPDTDGNSTVISQGDTNLGYAVHLIEGVPAFTVNYDGLRTTLKGKQPLSAGKVTLRALFGLDGTLAVGAASSTEDVRGYAPMEGGFPRPLEGALRVGQKGGPLSEELFPESTAFTGKMERVNLGLLPGVSVELRAAKAVPVE